MHLNFVWREKAYPDVAANTRAGLGAMDAFKKTKLRHEISEKAGVALSYFFIAQRNIARILPR